MKFDYQEHEKLGLVLSGGGARGAYQVGVWQAMNELHIPFSVVTGASVGALNGAMMTQGDLNLAVDIWSEITAQNVMSFESDADTSTKDGQRELILAITEKAIREKSIDQTPLKHLLARYLDINRVYESPVDFGLTAVTYPQFETKRLFKEDIPPEKMIDYLMASSACFPFFKPYTFDGVTYLDGGYSDNMPIQMAADRGVDRILAVDLKAVGVKRPYSRCPVPVTVIDSKDDLGFILLFDADFSRLNIRRGYLDAMRTFGQYDGCLYTFEKGAFSAYTAWFEENSQRVLNRIFPSEQEALLRSHIRRSLIRCMLSQTNKQIVSDAPALACAELAGKMLKLSPLEVYSEKEFCQKTLEHMSAVETPEYKEPEDLPELFQSIREDKVQARILYDLLCDEDREDDRKDKAMALFSCNLLPEASLAALFCYLVYPQGFHKA